MGGVEGLGGWPILTSHRARFGFDGNKAFPTRELQLETCLTSTP